MTLIITCNFARLYLVRVLNLLRHFTQNWSNRAYEIQEVSAIKFHRNAIFFFKCQALRLLFSFKIAAYAGQWSIHYTAATSTVWPVHIKLATVFLVLVHQSSGLKGFNLHLGEELLSCLSKFIAYSLFRARTIGQFLFPVFS